MIGPGDTPVNGAFCEEGHQIYYNGNYFCSEWETCFIMDPDHPDQELIERYKEQRNG